MPGHARHDSRRKWLAMAEQARHDSRRELSATAGQGLDRRNCGWLLSSRVYPGNNGPFCRLNVILIAAGKNGDAGTSPA